MAFIRLKRVGKDQYAYLVDNEWTPKGPRQRVKKYLGKYIELPQAQPTRLPLSAVLSANSLIKNELHTRGFSDKLIKGDIKVNLRSLSVKQKNKNVVLGLNGGFLCSYTLRKLLHFVPVVEVIQGYSLARAFSDAGIRVSREQFVAIYTKTYKPEPALNN